MILNISNPSTIATNVRYNNPFPGFPVLKDKIISKLKTNKNAFQ